MFALSPTSGDENDSAENKRRKKSSRGPKEPEGLDDDDEGRKAKHRFAFSELSLQTMTATKAKPTAIKRNQPREARRRRTSRGVWRISPSSSADFADCNQAPSRSSKPKPQSSDDEGEIDLHQSQTSVSANRSCRRRRRWLALLFSASDLPPPRASFLSSSPLVSHSDGLDNYKGASNLS